MLINVEHAPVLVVGRALSPLSRAEIDNALGHGLLDQLHGRGVIPVDGDDDVLAVHPVPVRQVDRLRPLALGEDQDGPAITGTGGPSPWLTAPLRSHAARPRRPARPR